MTCVKRIKSLDDLDRDNLYIQTDRLHIKVLRSEDITEEYISGLNDPEVNYFLEVKRNRQSFESVKSFVAENAQSASSLLLGIFLKTTDSLIGTVRLSGISFVHYHLGLGICIFAKQYWGKGYGVESVFAIKEFVFNDMGMHYIEAGMYSQNAASRKLFEKAGFECYVKVSDKYRLEDQFVDIVMFRAVNPNFNFDFREG